MMDWGASNAKCRMRRTRLPVSGEFISCSLTILVIARAAPSPASLRSFSSDAVYTGTDKSFDTVSSTFLKEADSFCARFWATAARLSEWVRAATRKNGKTTGRTDIERIRTFIETPPSGVLFPHHATVRASLQGVRPRQIGRHTSELQSPCNLVCRLLLEKKKTYQQILYHSHTKCKLTTYKIQCLPYKHP